MSDLTVAFIGLGTMGAPMAANLLEAGFDLTVHNRTRAREEVLAARGAKRAASPAEAARGADIVVTIVSDTPDVEAVLFHDGGIASTAGDGAVVIDMSTISPEATRTFGERLSVRGIGLLDAPVSGGPEGAAAGTLAIMVGGDAEHLARARPVLDTLGGTVTHVGPLGAGQTTKCVNQVIVGGYNLAIAEAVVLGLKAGLDMDVVLQAIGSGACRSWILENRAPNMVRDTYPLGFRLDLHLKDLGIVVETARELGLDMPLTELVRAVEHRVVGHRGGEDMSVMAADLRERAGL